MLQKMRSSTGSWVAKGILGLLVLSFLAWGVADYTTSGSTGTTVAEVGGQEIGYPEFLNAYQRFVQAQQLSGVGPEVAQQLGLADAVVSNLTTRTLYLAEARSMNLTASDPMVRQEIESRPSFQGPTGEFDRTRFNLFLADSRLSEAAMVETVRDDISRGQLIGALTAGSEAPDAMVRRLFDYVGERRSAEYLSFSIDSVGTPSSADDATLQAFYEDRKEDFRRPELRSLTYVLISPETIAETMEIAEAEIEAAYEARRQEFVQPEQRRIAQILFPSEAEAQAAAEALQGVPADGIPEKAEELGLELIELGSFSKAAVPNPSLAHAAFALDAPGATPAFEGAFGWSVAVVGAIEEGNDPALEDVRDRLARDIALEQAYNEVFQRGEQLEDGFGQGMSLEEAADAADLTARTVEAVDSSGRGPRGQALQDLPSGLSFLRTAFDLQAGEVSFLETTENNAMFMVRVDGITPAAIPPFEEIRDEVRTAWQEEARIDAAESRAETLAARLAEDGDLSLLAQMMGAETGTIDGFTRTGQGPDGARLPAALAQSLFDSEIGGTGFAGDDGTFYVARLTGVTPASEAAEPVLRENLNDAVAVGMAQDLVEQLGTALRDRFDIKTYPEVYQQVYR